MFSNGPLTCSMAISWRESLTPPWVTSSGNCELFHGVLVQWKIIRGSLTSPWANFSPGLCQVVLQPLPELFWGFCYCQGIHQHKRDPLALARVHQPSLENVRIVNGQLFLGVIDVASFGQPVLWQQESVDTMTSYGNSFIALRGSSASHRTKCLILISSRTSGASSLVSSVNIFCNQKNWQFNDIFVFKSNSFLKLSWSFCYRTQKMRSQASTSLQSRRQHSWL